MFSTSPLPMESVKCINTCSNAFYFEVETTEKDVAEDAFKKSTKRSSHWVRSEDNKYLLLNPEEQFQAQNLTQLTDSMKFQIQAYKDLTCSVGREGRSVMLYMKNGGENKVVCCDPNHRIYPKEMETLPVDIGSTKHPALFYMSQLTRCNAFEFESSFYPSEFLGFEPDSNNPSLYKLVLHKKERNDDRVDAIFLM
ncbi:il18 [Pungitius sinensis]